MNQTMSGAATQARIDQHARTYAGFIGNEIWTLEPGTAQNNVRGTGLDLFRLAGLAKAIACFQCSADDADTTSPAPIALSERDRRVMSDSIARNKAELNRKFGKLGTPEPAQQLADIVLRLNPAAGEIGAGMLANMQTLARRIIEG